MKKYLMISLSLIVVLCMLASCAGQTEQKPEEASDKLSDSEIIDIVVDNMMKIAEVPRPSHHEEKISKYLMGWASEQGLDPVCDSVKNVMFEVPATEGMEDLPLVILQGHMDMVAVAEEGKDFDPLTDPITLIRDDEKGTLTADGTSLGADDGVGDSIIMAVAQGKMAHGPLRVIITVNEEDGMDGAINMDPDWLEGAPYLINIDNEQADQVLVSTASGDNLTVTRKLAFTAPSGDKALKISISGLKGGHSGVEIDKGRLNGIVGLGIFLKKLDKEGISYELASFTGGVAGNAIPPSADATVVTSEEGRKQIMKMLEEYQSSLNKKYKDIEEGIRCEIADIDNVPEVITGKEKIKAIRFITKVITGVYTMSADMDGLVESSSNLGIFKLDPEGLSAVISIRSSDPDKREEIIDAQMGLAKKCGYDAEDVKFADAWKYDPDSKLTELTQKIYRDQNGEEINVVAVHGGLECGTFKKLKPDLDMISIGPDLKDVHTPNEVLYLNSIPKIWRLLEGILAEI